MSEHELTPPESTERPPMSDLIGEIRSARQLLREEESRTHDAAIELQNCKQRERKARGELDALLDALEGGDAVRCSPRPPLATAWTRPRLPRPPRHRCRAGARRKEGSLEHDHPSTFGCPGPGPPARPGRAAEAPGRGRGATPSWACC